MRRTYLLVATACGSSNQSPNDSGTVVAVIDGTAADALAGADAMPDAPPDALPGIPPSFECDVTQPGTVRVRTAGANNPLVIHDVFGKARFAHDERCRRRCRRIRTRLWRRHSGHREPVSHDHVRARW